jgi:hypothetical protein
MTIKKILYIILYLMFSLFVLGGLAPALVSATDWSLVGLGFIVVVVWLVVTLKLLGVKFE